MAKLLGVCGSVRTASLNRALLVALAEALGPSDSLTVYDGIGAFPIFSSELDDPPAVVAFKAAIGEADGVVFAVPEYNYSIPGGLKNALDWVSRPPASSPMRGKPVGMIGAATGMSGTIRAQAHLRQILLYSDTPVLAQPEVLIPRAHDRFDADRRLTDEPTRVLLARFGAAMTRFVERYRT